MVRTPSFSFTVKTRSYQASLLTEWKLTTKGLSSSETSVSGLPKSATHLTGRENTRPSPSATVSVFSAMSAARPT